MWIKKQSGEGGAGREQEAVLSLDSFWFKNGFPQMLLLVFFHLHGSAGIGQICQQGPFPE